MPRLEEKEVEIARISLDSVTYDQISIRARGELGNIHFRVVDEYKTEFLQPFHHGKYPLSLEELVKFIDSTNHPGDPYPNGLVQSHWNFIFHEERQIEEAVNFVHLESVFYPELVAYYTEIAREWIDRRNQEYAEEQEDEQEEEQADSESDLPRPEEIEIGPDLLDLLESWSNGYYGLSLKEKMNCLANALKGRGQEVVKYLEEVSSDQARGILEDIRSIADKYFGKDVPQLAGYNNPLKIIKWEVLGDSRYKPELEGLSMSAEMEVYRGVENDDIVILDAARRSFTRISGDWIVDTPITGADINDKFRLLADKTETDILLKECQRAMQSKPGPINSPRLRKMKMSKQHRNILTPTGLPPRKPVRDSKISSMTADDPIYSRGYVIGGKRLQDPKQNEGKSPKPYTEASRSDHEKRTDKMSEEFKDSLNKAARENGGTEPPKRLKP
ncbi:hypothetical protein ACFL3W_01305 [Pseudomonadota bacterium]